MTLAEFLLARIAEDEAEARLHYRDGLRWWESCAKAITAEEAEGSDIPHGPDEDCTCGVGEGNRRALAECDAKRRIVQFYNAVPDGMQEHYRAGLGRALRCLAVPYADHPDYQQEWTP